MMGLCLWVRWSDYKPSVIYVSVCVSVCVLILVRLEASNQTGHGVGRGERNEWKGRQTEGGTKCIKCTCWGGDASSRPHVLYVYRQAWLLQ